MPLLLLDFPPRVSPVRQEVQQQREEHAQKPQLTGVKIREIKAITINFRLSPWLGKYAHDLFERSCSPLSLTESLDFLFGQPSRKAEVGVIIQERNALREKALQLFEIQQHVDDLTKKKCALHDELQSRLSLAELKEINPRHPRVLEHELEEMRTNAEVHYRAVEPFRVVRDITELLRF